MNGRKLRRLWHAAAVLLPSYTKEGGKVALERFSRNLNCCYTMTGLYQLLFSRYHSIRPLSFRIIMQPSLFALNVHV